MSCTTEFQRQLEALGFQHSDNKRAKCKYPKYLSLSDEIIPKKENDNEKKCTSSNLTKEEQILVNIYRTKLLRLGVSKKAVNSIVQTSTLSELKHISQVQKKSIYSITRCYFSPFRPQTNKCQKKQKQPSSCMSKYPQELATSVDEGEIKKFMELGEQRSKPDIADMLNSRENIGNFTYSTQSEAKIPRVYARDVIVDDNTNKDRLAQHHNHCEEVENLAVRIELEQLIIDADN